MKKAVLLGLALTGLLAAAPATAETARTISMTGHGEVRAAPDLAQVTAGVTTNGATAAQALAANSSLMKSVFAALQKLGVPQRNIQTTGFSVSPQYSNGENNTS